MSSASPRGNMDVFYPSAGGNSIPGDPQNLDFSHCLGYYNYNKFGNNNNYMNMADASGALLAGDTFHTPSLGDEEFEIPPITPPPEIEPGMGLQEVDSAFPGLPDHPNSQRGLFTPQFPPQSLELPSITISRNMMEQEGQINNRHPGVSVCQTHLRQYPPNPTMVMRSIISMHNPNGMMSQNQLTTINQSQINPQLGLNMTGSNFAHASPSPPASKSATPSPSSSINEDDQEEGNRVIGEKRPAPDAGKKPKTPKKKKKKDPNEPQKPVSAYALFFRDSQAAIKGQNPNATFGEVSKIVASMWDGLGEEQKQKRALNKKESAAAESAEAQTIRSVQQTLASTSLSPALVLPSPLSQHPSMSAATQALQQALPRAIAPKPLQMRVGSSQIVTSVTVAHQNMTPGGVQSQLLGQMGAGGPQSDMSPQLSPPMQPQHASMQQQMQQQQMQQHLQHHQMQQQQMHHQQIQQQMQQQHFQHHLQQQLQQHHMQQQHHQQMQQQMQMQQMQQMQQHLPQSQCSPVQHSPGTPHSVSLGSPPPPPASQPHPSQVQAHAQVLSQVSIY
uniref:TOX high mobility group box family member 3-like n=1 Tax=Sinocyclocheilus rhinocerous TaxID=307959 RepID=A0A673KH12_9TELE